MPTSAAVYCRISRDRVGAGLGVERQLSDCQELAARLGWTVAVVHTDNDISAYSGKPRPGYRALLDDLAAGRTDAVLAWHTDRLHRSPAELEAYMEICERRGVPTHCVRAGALDLATASGRMTARILGAVARQEVEHSIERIRGEKMHAARAGRYRGGRRPLGYESDGVTIRDVEADAVLDATKRVLNGETLGTIAREWNAAGMASGVWRPPLTLPVWTSIAVHRVLTRARNAAVIERDGEWIAAATWPAIVPENLWAAVRCLLSDPARPRYSRGPDPRWLGSGLYLCGVCADGTTIGGVSTTRSATGPRATYRCRARAHLARVAAPVDELVTALVVGRLSRPDARLLLAPDAAVDTAALGVEAAALRVRLDELASLFADGAVTGRQLSEGTAKIRARLADVEVELASSAAGSPLAGFADSDDIAAAWAAATVSRRKAVIDALMVVSLLPASKGRRPGGGYFDPDCVRIEWKVI